MIRVNVIGAGLAGSEACYQLAKRGLEVHLYEMKPKQFSPAHKNPNFAELVCSNSLKSDLLASAGGMLKGELRAMDSLVIKIADEVKVPAGSALAVDRELFSQKITDTIKSFSNIIIHEEEIKNVDTSIPTILATGPLTSDDLSHWLQQFLGQEQFYFFDAIAPIVSKESLDPDKYYIADRYGEGSGDYINCPMNEAEYDLFYQELIHAEIVQLKDFENSKVFEGCMPVEVLAKRGRESLLFGPLKPVGLINPRTGKKDFAVVQLRKETKKDDLYNLVGFQTNLTYKEQKRVFSLIPALKNAEFYRYGVMHKNSYLNAPSILNCYSQVKKCPNVFVAGQLSGVEGYIESIASGLLCALNMIQYVKGLPMIEFPDTTMCGALLHYIAEADPKHFQPMSSNMGIVAPIEKRIKDKKERYTLYANRGITTVCQIMKSLERE